MNELLRMVVTMYPKIVPPGAEELLMASISKATQEKLLNMDREKAAGIIAGAVNDVNHGSVKRIDDLINLRLNWIPGDNETYLAARAEGMADGTLKISPDVETLKQLANKKFVAVILDMEEAAE